MRSSGGAAKLPLLEREEELGALAALVERTGSGSGGLVVIEGAEGIGKTRLLRCARELGAQSDMRVLSTAASELESGFAYGVLRSLLECALASLEVAEREAVLAGPATAAGALFGYGQWPPAPGSPDVAFALQHSLYWLALNLAALQPLLVVLDDAHWADRASLHWLAYLTRRIEGAPVAVVVASRPSEPGADTELVHTLASSETAKVLRPQPLSAAGVQRIVAAEVGEQARGALAAECHRASGGNPFMLGELLRALAEDGIEPSPEAVARLDAVTAPALGHALLARAARLPGDAVAVLKALAVLGRCAELQRLATLAGGRPSVVRDTVAALVDLSVLSEHEGFGFTHPMLQAAVYEEIAPSERATMHLTAARILIGTGAPPEEVSAHLLHADPESDPVLMEILREAARQATASGEGPAALPYLRRAYVELSPTSRPPELAIELARTLVACGDEAGIEMLRTAHATAAEPAQRAALALELGRALGAANRAQEACAVLSATSDGLDGGDPELEMLLETTLYNAARNTAIPDSRMLGRVRRFSPELPGDSPGERALLVALAGDRLLSGSSASAVAQLVHRVLDDRTPLDDAERMTRTQIAGLLVYCDELRPARRLLDELLSEARARGSPLGYVYTSAIRCMAALRQGDVKEALADGQSAIDVAEAHGIRLQLGLAFGPYIDALVANGEPGEALACAERYLELDDQREVSSHALFLHSRGQAHLAAGAVEDALVDLRFVGEAMDRWGVSCPGLQPWRSTLAEAMRRTGEREAARPLALEGVALARSFGTARPLGIALIVQASCETRPAALKLLDEAVELLEGSEARLERARALAALGAALRRDNQRTAARERLLAALDLAHRCGSPPVEKLAREELAALGTRPRRALVAGPDALTASEARVAAMAAEGLSNKQIAQALFVTPKTVETHLSRSYTKLGISSRRDLPAALGGAAGTGEISV
jgi:DNA-binding CsgD family transcriptional regulator